MKSATDLSAFSLSFEFGSNNTSYNAMYLVTGPEGVEDLTYTTPEKTKEYLILNKELQENYQSLQTFFVDEDQEITGSIADIAEFNNFMENYVTLKVNFSLVTIFEELAEGLKNLALGFVNAFSGLGPIFYKNGLTFVSIFLIGGVALTIGFWAIDKLLGLGKMGLGSLGKARAKKSKKGQ